MPNPSEILDTAFERALQNLQAASVADPESVAGAELISRNQQNRAAVRLVLACALAKIHRPELDIQKPYTEIGTPDAFSGRTYDEQYVGSFLFRHQLPANDTTAFLTPALRNRNQALTQNTNLVGRPPAVYQAALNLLAAVKEEKFTASDLLTEVVRWLIIVRDEKRQRMELLMKGAQSAAQGAIPLSAEEIVTLIEQHLRSPYSSRLPVLMVAAAYEAAQTLLGERALPLEGHNAADRQTGSIGDVEVTLVGDNNVVTGYEMKTRRVTQGDIDIAVQKVLLRGGIQNYLFITTETIDREVSEYAARQYERTAGVEVVVLDCISFLRHFLHLFHRRRGAFVESYQKRVLEQPESAVRQPLKETWFALRQAAESRPETDADE